jgi:hypothetical protein
MYTRILELTEKDTLDWELLPIVGFGHFRVSIGTYRISVSSGTNQCRPYADIVVRDIENRLIFELRRYDNGVLESAVFDSIRRRNTKEKDESLQNFVKMLGSLGE